MNRLTVFMESAAKATLACSMWLSMSRWSNQSKSRKRCHTGGVGFVSRRGDGACGGLWSATIFCMGRSHQ